MVLDVNILFWKRSVFLQRTNLPQIKIPHDYFPNYKTQQNEEQLQQNNNNTYNLKKYIDLLKK